MKAFILPITVIAVLFFSCKKDSHIADSQLSSPNSKKYAVTFTVAQFTQTVTTIGSLNSSRKRSINRAVVQDTSALAKQLYEYYYVAYNAAGVEVRRIHRVSFNTSFEEIYHSGPNYNESHVPGLKEITTKDPFNILTDSLAAGTYTVVIVGTSSDNGIELNNFNGTDTEDLDYSNYPQAVVYPSEGLDAITRSQDLFFFKTTLTVGNQNIMQNVTLNRVVGQLEVNLEDAIPNNVAYILVGRDGENAGYALKNEVSVGSTIYEDFTDIYDDRTNIASTDKGKQNFMFYRYVLNTVQPINIILEAHDATTKLLYTKTIKNVPFYKNRRTILTGKLFDTTSTVQFNIKANLVWGPDGPTIHF